MKQPIPDAALDDRLFFGGTAGAGKTYNAAGRVERLLKRHARVVIPDPLGVWWGLRLAADGKAPSGYDVVIFGGPHGDLPLTEQAGALIGETVAGMKESCILDLSQLGTKASERRFMLAFLTALYKHTPGEPLHVIFDEADMWAPQRLLDKDGDAARLLGMMETIVRRGRVKGFIPWLISQRPAVITKDILSQADGIVAFKLTSSQDRKAIEAWVEGQADAKTWEAISAQLPTMERGQGLVWIPGRGVLETVQFPEKETFDSSRTPKRGEKLKRTAALKPIDLGAVKGRLATVETEAKANDPKALRAAGAEKDRKIAALERELTLKSTAATAPAKPDQDAIAAAEKRGFERAKSEAVDAARTMLIDTVAAIEKSLNPLSEALSDTVHKMRAATTDQLKSLVRQRQALKPVYSPPQATAPARSSGPPLSPSQLKPIPPKAPPSQALAPGAVAYTGPQLKILRSLAMWRALGNNAPSREMVAAIAGYQPNSGSFRNLIGALNSSGAVTYPLPGHIKLLADGVDVPNADEARTILCSNLSGPQKKIVAALVDQGTRTREDVANDAGYQVDSGSFRNIIGALRTLGLVDYPAAGQVGMSPWAQDLLSGNIERLAA